MTSNQPPRWGKAKDRPVWWPLNVPYVSPRQHMSVDEMQHVVVAAYIHFGSLELLGAKGEEMSSKFDLN